MNNLYKKMFEQHKSIMLLIDPINGGILKANEAAINYYGYPREELLTMKIQDINTYTDIETNEEMNLAKSENRNYFRFTHQLANNESREVEVHSFPVEIDNRSLLYSIIHDVSNKVEQGLMLESLYLNSPYGVAILDQHQNIVTINENFTNLFKYSLNEVKGHKISGLISGHDQLEMIDNNIQLIYKGGIFKQEGKRISKDGELIDVEILGYPVINRGKIIGAYLIYSDITHVKALQQIDTLTGLFNRDYFLELTNECINDCKNENKKFAMILVNLIKFREINDSLGYDIGDKLLISLTQRLNAQKNNKDLISRFGDDEFAILCKLEDKDEVESYVSILLENIRESFILGATTLNVNAKIGISMYPDDGTNAASLTRNAGIAMYKAGDSMEDKVHFYTLEMSKEMEKNFLITNHLVRAISKNELFLYYQPIFDIKEFSHIVGLEALLRWKDPILGIIAPDIFIPLAEKSGQIISIGQWVLDNVCQQISSWKNRGYTTVPIAINISVKQLEQSGFAQLVLECLEKYNLESNSIELEITESVSSGDLLNIIKNLKELKEHGINISMDDFGTGFSSLGQLDLFELDKLKIDKIFIDDIASTSKRRSLVSSIIAMAKSLELTVIAEGIETKEQLSYLKESGCQLGQGYLFSKPLPAEEIEILIK